MGKVYTSLMFDTLGLKTSAANELERAALSGEHLISVLKAIPSFKAMVRERLLEKVHALNPSADIDRVFINRGAYAEDLGNRPAGSLLDVFFECVSNGIFPSYVIGDDGVYDRPDTNANEFRVAGLDIANVENILDQSLRYMHTEHQAALKKYWATPSMGNSGGTQKNILQDAMVCTLLSELSLSVIGGVIEEYQGRRVADISLSGGGQSIYRVSSNKENIDNRLTACFVVHTSGLSPSELSLDDDLYGYVSYMPGYGFEYFHSSNELHAALCSRLNVPGSDIKYINLGVSVFEHFTDVRLKSQKAEFTKLFGLQEVYGPLRLAALETVQSMATIKNDWLSQLEALRVAIKRTEWPTWLTSASKEIQERYEELDYSQLKYQQEFKKAFDKFFSLNEYARKRVSQWSQSAWGVQCDSDTVQVHSRYEIKVEEKTIIQEDSRTLTEFVAFGLHDADHRVSLRLEGAESLAGLSAAKLEGWLQTVDVRTDFVDMQSSVPPGEYFEALRNQQRSKIEYELFVARYTGKFNDADVNLVNRGMLGDSGVTVNGVNIEEAIYPLQDVLVFQGQQASYGAQQVFLRNPQGRYEFLRFNNFADFAVRLKSWMVEDPAYANSLFNPNDQFRMSEVMRRARGWQHTVDAIPVRLAPLKSTTQSAPDGFALMAYRWTLAEINRLAPLNYRRAQRTLRQQHARLSTELKALYTLEARELGFPSFEEFSRNLIKSKVEEVLRASGSYVTVDPDLIYVQISADEQMSLTNLIVEGRSFEPNYSPQPLPGSYPKFYVASGHPAIDELDIRHISSWSKTLRSGDKYIDLLKSDYLTYGLPAGKIRREVNFKRVVGEMHRDVLSQYFEGRLSADQFTGLTSLVTGLQVPEAQKNSDPVVDSESVYRFRLEKTRNVEGVYIFRARVGGRLEDFLYTPEAPDGIAFRLASSFAWSIRDRNGLLRDYYINRVTILDKKIVNDYFDQLVATVDTVMPPQPLVGMRVRDLRTAYELKINRVIDDIDAQTTSLNEIIAGLIYDNVLLAATIISLVVPPVGLLVTAVEVSKSFYDGVKAQYYGDYDASFTHFKDALVGLATLGKGTLGGEKVTKVQKGLIHLMGEAKSVVSLAAKVTGQKLGHERLLEIVQQVLDEENASRSKTSLI